MAYFSRLTDIVTCNLTTLLAQAENATETLEAIIREMTEGAAGAERSVRTAANNVIRIESEISEQRGEVRNWVTRAQDALRSSDENSARQALARKHEVEDLIAGLEQQLQAAVATRDHLKTMMQALQARLADAHRRLQEMKSGPGTPSAASSTSSTASPNVSSPHRDRIDAELEELRRQLQQG